MKYTKNDDQENSNKFQLINGAVKTNNEGSTSTRTIVTTTSVCSYVQKHDIDALEGFSQLLAVMSKNMLLQETGKSLLEHQ